MSEKTSLFEQIAKNLVGHDMIEREIFYPACEREIDEEHVLKESLVEHGVVEFCLVRADKNRRSEKLDSYIKVLKEIVNHHVQEEENELLPKANRELDEEMLESLATKMEARFAKALESDFRRPLNDAVQQLLTGKTKTTPKRSTVQARRRAPAKTTRAARSGRTTRRAQTKRAKPRGRASQGR